MPLNKDAIIGIVIENGVKGGWFKLISLQPCGSRTPVYKVPHFDLKTLKQSSSSTETVLLILGCRNCQHTHFLCDFRRLQDNVYMADPRILVRFHTGIRLLTLSLV